MSKIAFNSNESGTGTFTIASPNSNTNRTLTLPDAEGEILIDGSILNAGDLAGALPAIDGSQLTGLTSLDMTVSRSNSDRSNGYMYFSNGMLIHWWWRSGTGNQTYTFPLSYTYVYGAWGQSFTGGDGQLRCEALSTTSVRFDNAFAFVPGFVWILGYKA